MRVFFLTSRNIDVHILVDITVLLSLTRGRLWKKLNLVASYCHKALFSVNDAKSPFRQAFSNILKRVMNSPVQQVNLDRYFGDLSLSTHSAGLSGCRRIQ